MKILLFEQGVGGHYDNYLRALVPRAATKAGEVVVAMTPRLPGADALSPETWKGLSNVEVVDLPRGDPAFGPSARVAAMRGLRHVMRRYRPDRVLVPSADPLLPGLVADRDAAKSIEATFHYGYGFAARSVKDRWKELVYSSLYRRLRVSRVNFVNFAYYEYALQKRLIDPARIRLVGDPVPAPQPIGRREARLRLGLDESARYVGLVGSLDDRKALPLLLNAYRAGGFAEDVKLLLAGRLSPSYRERLPREHADLVRSGRLILIDRKLSESELRFGLEALDVMALVYWNFPGLSSLALRSMSYGTPIVSHRFGWLQATIERFGVGVATDAFHGETFARDLKRALEDGPRRDISEPARRLLAFCSEQAFADRMLETLDPRAAEAAPSWDWVREVSG